jgi:xanthine dehydrogenase small subunit
MAFVAKKDGGVVTEIAIGGASLREMPIRCTAAEDAVRGKTLDAAVIAAARAAMTGEIVPIDDIRSTGKYRVQVIGNILEELLKELAQS